MTGPVEVTVKRELLRWARERVSLAPMELSEKFGWKQDTRVKQWEETGKISLAHLERLAEKTHTPVGYLFLPEPPADNLPIADFRTVEGAELERPSPDLLDTLYTCQTRQEWFREYLVLQGEEPLLFVSSARVSDSIVRVGTEIRNTIGFDLEARAAMPTWEEALRTMVENTEDAGILVMRNGVVGNNTHRKLDVKEFRGFAISDPYSPLVFVNAADSKAAQMFTLAHELAHIWIGATGVSNWRLYVNRATERFCNAVAAEILVPQEAFRRAWRSSASPLDEAQRLARQFKTSALVILIRAREAELLTSDRFDELYEAALSLVRERAGAGGGDFYRTQGSRLGKRFSRAVVTSALEGHLMFREAFDLLGFRKAETFMEFAKSLGVAA